MINEDTISEAIKHLKANKTDPFSDLTTSCFVEAPYILLSAMTVFFRLCLIHNYFPKELLLAKIITLLKDMNGDITSLDNYRSIALSSIFRKIWEWIFILLYGDKLKTNDLQFGFQKSAGTEMCTWALLESIDYLTNKGSMGVVTFMDCSKAYEKIIHSKLFESLLAKKLNQMIVRILVHCYRKQSAFVS